MHVFSVSLCDVLFTQTLFPSVAEKLLKLFSRKLILFDLISVNSSHFKEIFFDALQTTRNVTCFLFINRFT